MQNNSSDMHLTDKQHPLLQSQLGVFIECMQYPDCTQYNIPMITPLGREVDHDRMERAFHVIYDSRVTWRLRFGIDDEGNPFQYDDAAKEFHVIRRQMIDAELQQYAYHEFVRPFDLMGEEPLIRVELVSTEVQDYLLMDVHHLIMDGISYTPLWSHRDFAEAYQYGSLTAETYTLLDAADDEQQTLHGESYERARAYYAEKYSDVDFATLSSRPASPLGQMLRVHEYVGKTEVDAWCREHGVAANLLFQAAFSYVMSVVLREDRIAYTTVTHGRFDRRWRNIYGMFSREVPVMSELKDGQTVLDYIRSFRAELMSAIRYSDYPISHLCRNHKKDLGATFNFFAMTESEESLSVEDKRYPFKQQERTSVTIDMNVDVYVFDSSYDIRVDSSEAMNSIDTLQMVAHAIGVTLQKMMHQPDALVKSLSIVSVEEELRLIELGTGERLDYPSTSSGQAPKTFIDIFKDQANKTPDAIAVVDYCSQLTYKELDEASDEYAKTVTPHTFVCVEMPRVKEFVVAVLGIWKAGSAYVPIDMEYPEERKRFMREECDGKPLSQSDIAYMIYTSGSTGKPKGVMISHAGLTNYIYSTIAINGVLPSDRISAYRSFSFDSHIEEFYPTLAVGASVYIVPEEIRHDTDLQYQFIKDNHIDGCYFPTRLAELLYNGYDLPVRFIGAVGERLTNVISGKNGVQFLNTYGPTECTDHISVFVLENGSVYKSIPIGRPLHNGKVFIIDSSHHLVPEGCVGELCFSSVQLAVGYYNNPEQTAERFVEVTINGRQERIYKTGDLCRWNSDGQLEYIGRIDNQVKLRGFRIELGEIESAAMQMDGIKQAVAVVKDDQIVLYYVNETACAYKDETLRYENLLRSNLSLSLPKYMVPSVYVHLDAMPLTPNGKIDRKALPEPEYKSASIVLPATKAEHDVLGVVADMMEIEPISVTTNLISLGLSSISAMRLAMRISQQLGKTISMSQLMSSPTIRDIAANLNNAADDSLGKVRDKQEYYPLTDNQLGVYLDWEQHRDGLQYNVPVAIKLNGYDANRLQTAISTVVAAHPYLFAQLAIANGEVRIKRNEPQSYHCAIIHLEDEPTAEFFQSRVQPFNLFEDSLFRFEIYTYKEATYLFEDIHHIITDGVSDAQLMSEIFAAYNGETIETETYTAYDRAIEEQEIKESTAYTEAEEYYKTLLSDVESTVYPHSTGNLGEGMASYVHESLGKKAIESHCAKLGVTPGNYLLTVFLEVLKRITREEKVMITTVNSGREHAAMQNIHGFFVKTLPVVSAATPADIQRQLIESISHECYPLTEMVQTMGIHPEILYAYEGGLFGDERIREKNGLSVIPLSLDTVKVPITLTVNPGSENFELSIEYDDSLYSEADMQTLLHSIIVLAENYAKETSISLQDCSMLTDKEEQQLIELGTGERLDYPSTSSGQVPKTFIDLFVEQVKKTPDAIAVVDYCSQMTYKELDEASDEYAKAVTSGTFVCLEMPRVKEFIVAVLGIWKAGSAYVPIDMEYPEERKRFMREECDGKPLPQRDIAYMIYTSGSTGKPKGVMNTHRGLLNFIHWNNKSFIQHEGTQHIVHSSFSFDATLFDLFCPLAVGASVHIIDEELRYDIDGLAQYIRDKRITGMLITPQIGAELLQQDSLPLDYIILGGDRMPKVEKHDFRIYNAYGPTEFTSCSSFHHLLDYGQENIPIGCPVPNTCSYILDSYGKLLPQGVAGELCLAGPQIAIGYWNNPELTAERFVEVTINGKKKRIYKTGDLCRWNKDGQLEYIGRIDNQVKLRGFRIELGEIESAALQIDSIKQAVAVVKNEQIVLYYVNETACAYEDETLRYENLLRSNLSLSLPEYMVPSVYVRLDAMPLTPNGKIDRKALTEPEYMSDSIVLPATKAEQDVLGVVEDMMGISPVSVTANLISLGLSSISAMRLAMRLSQQLGKTISMSQLMASPTIRDVAANLNNAADNTLGKVHDKQEYYPLTDNQLGVYLDWEQHRYGLQYNVPVAIRLKGYDANRLQAAISTAVAAHPYLFAQLAITNGEVRIKRNEPQSYHCAITELEEEPTDEFFQSRVLPFNLFEDSLFRFEIYTYKEATYLFEDIHHIITDGVSDAQLMSEIFAAYNGETIETETYTAYDRAIEEQEIKESSAYTESAEYYKNLLSDVESTVYPHSLLYDSGQTAEGMARYVHGSLGKKAIEHHCASLGVTPGNYLLTVFMEVLKRITREEKVMITTVNSGREHAAMQNIHGFFVKTLPVVSAATPADIQRQLIESISHECYPLTEMVQTMGIHPEILYAYEGGLFDDERIREKNDLSVIPLSLDTVKVPLTLTVNPGSEDYELSIEYNDALYNEQDMQTLLHSIIVLAENYAKETSISLQDCSMLTDKEEQQLIELSTGERLDYPSTSSGQVPKTFIDLFKEQVAKTPDAIAIVDYCSQLTYKELDEASDEYAKTVTSGTFVCVEMPRVKEFVVAVLGIWKAGSAYVPIDAEYPEERKHFMREECDGKPLPQPDVAYMIYTSGSTGKPKGVMVQHSALLNFIQFISKEWHLTDQSRIICHSNFAFDASIEDLYPVLTVGGTMFIVPKDVRMDITMTYDYIVKNGITGGCYSTQFAQLLLQQYPDLPVEYLAVGGEKMTKCPAHVCRLINTYGPTECTVDATYYCFEAGKEYSEIPIGRVLANLNCYIIDRQDNLIPQGAPGELCIAGPQLALGYYNNPELTSERFVEVTINGRTERIYKTGDLCRWNNEGQLEYIGRIDNQIKLRGFRIELGEIESAAMHIDGIKQAVAVVKNEQIVLYYVNEMACAYEDETLRYENLLRSNLSLSLPEYMVPSVYVPLDAMPLTPNGKTDRKALPEPVMVLEEYVAPRNETERIIADTFKEVLALDAEISVTSRFYSLGGDSIKSIRLVSLLAQKGYRLSVADVMKLQTPEALAAIAVNTDAEEEDFSIMLPVTKRYPLTPMQEAMLLKHLSDPDSWGYRLVSRYKLNIVPTENQLRTALNALATEHETLRTRILYKGIEVPEQEIADREIPVSFEDIRETNRTIAEIHTEQLKLGFDLEEDSLMRVVCIVTADNECQLLIAMHHIITDGWSTPIYLSHFFLYLKDAIEGKDIEITESDAGLFEQHVRSLQMRDKDASLQYWYDLLEGYETKAEIVSYDDDNPSLRQAQDKLSSGQAPEVNDHLSVVLNQEQTEMLKSVCSSNNATLSHATELAWGIVLQRYTRQDDVVFAKVVSCRDKAPMDMSHVVGPFINSIPVRVKTDNSQTIADALQCISQQAAESNAHDYCSMSEIQQQSELGSNLFQSILAFENYPVSDEIKAQFDEADATLTIEPQDNQEESFNDITLTAYEREGQLCLNLTYDSEKFAERDMQAVLQAWQHVIVQTAKTPETSINEIGLLSEDEELRLIELGTGERLDYDRSKTFIDLFKEQAKKTPEAVAVVDYCSQLTYKELDEASDKYAKSVTPGTFVCVEMPRVKEFVVAVLGIWKAGSAYVPIDMEYPEERKHLMREECDGKPLPQPDIAYMIYTSGSTGKPKGVMIQHSAYLNYLHFYVHQQQLTSIDRMACHRNFCFDASLEDLFPILSTGGELHLMPEEIRMDLTAIRQFILTREITCCSFTTSLGELMFKAYPDLPLRYMVVSGEKLNPIDNLQIPLWNFYGPTECTVDCVTCQIESGKAYTDVPIGKTVNNMTALILDSDQRFLPQGTAGELCIAGPQLALGYYNNPELTSERFVEVTINGKKERIYKTGDLCRWNKDGQLEYIGRIDNQVKLRGFRIELGEIESAALQIDSIKQAVAVVKNEQIVLYYVNETACAYADETLRYENLLRSNLSLSLPEYMVPSVYVPLDVMPLTPNGKIDRKALPEPEMVQEEYVAPRNETERIIADTFKEVLALDAEISVTSRFYSLGGDSIKSIRLVSLLAQKGYILSVADVMKLQTPETLAQIAVNTDAEEENFALMLPVTKRYPLTSMQEAMLLKHLSDPDSWGYRLVSRYKLNIVPTENQLRTALNALATEHETLRTRILYKGIEVPEQEIADREIPVSFEDIRETNRTIAEIHTEQLKLGFDLEEDSLMRVVCIVTADNECQLLIAMHHIITDGWSTPIYLSHFFLHLKYAIEGKDIEITESDAGMFEQHVRSLQMRDKDASLQYWHDLLEGYETKAEIVSYDDDTLRYDDDDKEANDHLSVELSKDQTEILKSVCSSNNATLSHATELAWGIVLQRYTRQDDVVFAKVVSCRDKAPMDMSHVVGPFINSIPVRVKTDNSQTIADALQGISQQAAESNAHDYCSMSEIQQQSELGSSLFQSILAFENYPVSDEIKKQFDEANATLTVEPQNNEEESFNDITLTAYEREGQLCLNLTYDSEKFTERDMQAILQAWQNVLMQTVKTPEASINEIGLLSEDEEHRLIELGTGERLDYDSSKTFIDLFKEQVAKTPDAIAIVDYCSQLTYKELDKASDEYAKTVTPGTFVCLEMPRVKEFVVAVLGIWKACSAYVPIDMEYPEERKHFMREECDGKPLPQSDIVYMIYTSGSTGKPKGVMIQHSALLNFIQFISKEWHLTGQSRISCHSNFAFDASVEDLYPVLTVGGTMYIVPEDVRMDIAMMHDFIVTNGINGGSYATQFAQLLLQQYPHLPVEYLVLGGEKMTKSLPCDCRLINAYGPTECTVDAIYYCFGSGKDYSEIPIGRPLANLNCYITDREGNLMPQGTAGELCIAGPQLALGYYNNPELTAERFVEVTINGRQERIYKTGDLCRWNSDGQLEYIGRIDNQVKLRGFRIELGEIESAAMQMDGIKQAVAVVKDDQIVLYYVNETACAYKDETLRYENLLRSNLSLSLPKYMVPSVYVHLDAMPLTPNGKIDRKALPEPEYMSDSIVLPATKDEQEVLGVVADMMEIEPISVTANLISLGLSSISAMRLAMRISQLLGKTISMSQLMSSPTIRDIAANLMPVADSNLGKARDKQEYYPLTDNQLGVYLDWEQHRDGLQYNVPVAIKLNGYDANRLQEAISTVVAAHPYLFAQLAITNGEVRIRRNESQSYHCAITQLKEEPADEFFQSRVQPFNLFEDSLFRFELYTHKETIYLFEDIHHIITDGVSDAQLMSEILAAYNGETIEAETYTAYDRAIEELEIKESSAYTEAEEYYKNLLSDVESTVYPHSLRFDSGQAVDNLGVGRAKYVQVSLDRKDIESHSASLGVTPSNYLLTVFMEVLKRVTRETRVLITTVNSGREHAAMQDIQGFFVKTLPVVSENTVAEVQKQLIESISHECYPLTEMVQTLGIHPEIMYAYEGGLMDDEKIHDTNDVSIIPLTLDTAKTPLTLAVNPESKAYVLSIEYNDALYKEHDMQTLLHSIVVLAENYAKDTSASLQDCSMLTVEEEHRLIELGTGEKLEYDRSKTIIDLFREQAKQTPDATAVAYKERTYTYKELDEITDRLAVELHSMGVGPEVTVGVKIDRSELMVIYPLSIMKAGGAYMPLDPTFPEERLSYMCKEAGVEIILTDDGLANSPAVTREDVNQLPKASPDNKFVILYTSGSTGKPKGVVLEHHSIVNFCHWYVRAFNMTSADKALAYASFGFDAHMIDIYPSLISGAGTVILPREDRLDVDSIIRTIDNHGITVAFFTTQIAKLLFDVLESTGIRTISYGGEQTPPVKYRRYKQYHVYGPTECTLFSSYFPILSAEENPPIGTALPNYRLFVVDKNLDLVGKGMPGELVIAGEGLSRGYLDKHQTEERFVEITLNNEKVKVYKTGDLCRRNSEGQLEYVGRIDNQIKLRGYRIELGEIESAAMQMDDIKQVVAVVKDEQIVLYYVNEMACAYEDETLRYENLLRSNLSLSLPEYMVPSVYVRLDAMPLTPNGKIDRKALPEPEYKSENIALPVTKAEQNVLGIVEDMMGISPVSVTANLISLGLSSISAMRLAMRISQQLGKTISMSQLMASPTIRDIAANLNSVTYSNYGKVRDKQEYYPLTDNQLGVYLDWEQHRDGLQYNVPVAIKFNGYDANRLQTAVSDVIAAHPYLFAQLAMVDGEVKIRRANSEELTVNIEQLTNEPAAEFFQSRVRPFNLFEDRLFCFEIYTYGEETYLFKDIHHIITDGVSDAKLMSEIFAAYNGEPIETETYTAYDRAIEEQEIKESTAYTEAEEYYKNLLSDVESTVYPHSLRYDSGQTAEGTAEGMAKYVYGSLGKKAIEHHCASLGVTPGNYLLTVFLEVLKRITREKKVMITTVNSGREHAAMQNIQGFFVKTLPVVSAATPADIQRQLIESISHECYPLTEMVQTMGIHPEILYAYEGGLFDDERIREKNDISVIPLSLDTVKVPLTLTVNPGSENFELSIEYDDALYNEQDMQTLLHSIIVLAENYAKETSISLQDCSMLTVKEEQQLIELGTGERLDYDRSKTFIDLFKEQVAKTPDAIAIVDYCSQLTYKELDEASDEYAKTVTPHTFVCVALPRVKEFVVAVLGIWKAGSAYVPIDMEYPEERKHFMREECDGKPLPQPDVAYMIYTSGSTGKPKGVMVCHEGLLSLVLWNNAKLFQGIGTRHLIHSSFSFDASVFEFVCPLGTGGEIHILDEQLRYDMHGMIEYIHEQRITAMTVSTQLGVELLRNNDLTLDYMMLAGEKMPCLSKPKYRLLNGYGPTEFTVCSSYYELRGSETSDYPIGRPVPNSNSYICDKAGNLLPQGSVGELCLAGPQLALGYYNNPKLTSELFVEVTINGKTERIYKTGDLCRWNSEWQLEYIGRIDNQVKLRGFRIELGEIESAAMQISGIKQAVAAVKNEQIVLYYVNETACTYEDETLRYENLLRSNLSLSLPEYMVPSVYVHLDAMPLTPNGKIDQKALPEPELVKEYVAPESRNEKLLCKLIEDLLGLECVGVTDSLNACGMSSIVAMRFNLLLHKAGIDMNISTIQKADNVRNICKYIEEGIDNSDIGCWLDDFDPDKPTIVLCCGVIGSNKITCNLTDWRGRYNIYVLQPIFNAWSDVEQLSHGEIVARYHEQMRRDIHGEIKCIIGFSYGGELAYHLTTMWDNGESAKPIVLMGDTIIVKFEVTGNDIKEKIGNEMEMYCYELQEEFFSKRERLPLIPYAGETILISAMQEAPYKHSNEDEWKQLNPRIRIVEIDDTHDGLYEKAEHYGRYIKIIGD